MVSRGIVPSTNSFYSIFIISKQSSSNNNGEGYVGNFPLCASLLYGDPSFVTASHELGHNLGLQHIFESTTNDARGGVLLYGRTRHLPPISSTRNIMDYYKTGKEKEPRRSFFLFQINHLKGK